MLRCNENVTQQEVEKNYQDMVDKGNRHVGISQNELNGAGPYLKKSRTYLIYVYTFKPTFVNN